MSKAQWIKENLKSGESYAGIVLGKDGGPDYHLIALPGEAEEVTFKQAQEWAKKQGGELLSHDEFTGKSVGFMPTRREQSLLFANLKEEFQPRWYWSGEKHVSVSDYAWCQDFGNGSQYYHSTINKFRARAVRRLPI